MIGVCGLDGPAALRLYDDERSDVALEIAEYGNPGSWVKSEIDRHGRCPSREHERVVAALMGFPKRILFDRRAGFHAALSIEVSNVVFTPE